MFTSLCVYVGHTGPFTQRLKHLGGVTMVYVAYCEWT